MLLFFIEVADDDLVSVALDYYCFTASILLFLPSLGSGDADRTSTLFGMFFVKNFDELPFAAGSLPPSVSADVIRSFAEDFF